MDPDAPASDSKQARRQEVGRALSHIWSFLEGYLPLANSHGADFLTQGHWQRLLPEPWRPQLLALSRQQLVQLSQFGLDPRPGTPATDGQQQAVTPVTGGQPQAVTPVTGGQQQAATPATGGQQQAATPATGGQQQAATPATGGQQQAATPHDAHAGTEVEQDDSLSSFIAGAARCHLENTSTLSTISDIMDSTEQMHVIKKENHNRVDVVCEGMSEKKSHEIGAISSALMALITHSQAEIIIDVGSGKGYLGCELSLRHKIPVIGLDSCDTNTHSALMRDEKISKRWQKQTWNRETKPWNAENMSHRAADVSKASQGTATDMPASSQTATDMPACSQTTTDTPACSQTDTDKPACSQTATDTPACSQTATDTPACSQTATDMPACSQTATDTSACSQIATDTPACSQTATDTPACSQTATDTPACSQTSVQPVQVSDPGGCVSNMDAGSDRFLRAMSISESCVFSEAITVDLPHIEGKTCINCCVDGSSGSLKQTEHPSVCQRLSDLGNSSVSNSSCVSGCESTSGDGSCSWVAPGCSCSCQRFPTQNRDSRCECRYSQLGTMKQCASLNSDIFRPAVSPVTFQSNRVHTTDQVSCPAVTTPGTSLYVPLTLAVHPDMNLCQIVEQHAWKLGITQSSSARILCTGLHACGSLSVTAMKLFLHNPAVVGLCVVGCCYQLMEESCLDPADEVSAHSQTAHFPLSQFGQQLGLKLGRNARNLASQSVDRMQASGQLQGVDFCWRAMLELLLHELRLPVPDKIVGMRRLHKRSQNFLDYVRASLSKLHLDPDLQLVWLADVMCCNWCGWQMLCVGERTSNNLAGALMRVARIVQACPELVASIEARCGDLADKMSAFVQVKLVLAPVIEALLLLDRYLYLLEQDSIHDAHIVRLFEPVISPRCHAILAWK